MGLGLMGGSFAKVLTGLGLQVKAIDPNPDTIGYALHKGYIAEGSVDVDEAYIKEADLIVFALYPKTLVEWISRYQYLIDSAAPSAT